MGSLVDKRYYVLDPKLGTGGLYATCERKSGEDGTGDASFAIQTDRGVQLTPKRSPHHYKLLGFYGDDKLSCSVDGIGIMSFFYFSSLNAPVHQIVDLDTYLDKPGTHTLSCNDVDLIGECIPAGNINSN